MSEVCAVVVISTVEADNPDEAIAFVRAELSMQLGDAMGWCGRRSSRTSCRAGKWRASGARRDSMSRAGWRSEATGHALGDWWARKGWGRQRAATPA